MFASEFAEMQQVLFFRGLVLRGQFLDSALKTDEEEGDES